MTRIRNAEIEDAPYILGLIKELAHFENEPEAVEITLEDLRSHGFGTAPKFHCFVAEVDHEIVGMALIYPRYSTWKGPALHLEDLIVKQQYRGRGIGAKLLSQVVSFAKAAGVKRLGWEVLDWNTEAIAFYESRGAKILKEWRVVQMDAQAIDQYR
jgi:GNAT superfamily N-acetyltransferase